MQIILIVDQSINPLSNLSKRWPPMIGAIRVLMAKHCEKSAIEKPLCEGGACLIIASVAVGRNAAIAIAIGN